MKHLLILITLSLPLLAQEKEPRENLIEALMNAPDDAALATAIEAGKKGGLPAQMFLEARFMLLINQDDNQGLAALAPALEKQLPTYSFDNTMIFGTKEDFESIVHYTKSLAALQKGDTATFKKHITEAFWLSPSHASQFAPHINQVRLEEAMSKVTLDLDRTFEDQKNGNKKTSLKDLAGEAPAFLLHFWSPWVQSSLLAMPEYSQVAKHLAAHQIPTASFLISGTAETRKDAAEFIAQEKDLAPGHWLIDERKNSLSAKLRIAGFPTVILVNRDGRILFNGDPANPRLWETLKTLSPKIEPPTINPVLPQHDLDEDILPQEDDE